MQNAVGRTSALTSVACVGLIAAGTLTDASFARLLQVAAVLFFMGAVVSRFTLTKPGVAALPGYSDSWNSTIAATDSTASLRATRRSATEGAESTA
jgi:hypothetical protein